MDSYRGLRWPRAKIRAENDELYAQTFQNLFLGLPATHMEHEIPSTRELYKNRWPYVFGELPSNVQPTLLTAGVDIQGDRIEALIYAFSGKKGYLFDHRVFWGDTKCDPYEGPWGELWEWANAQNEKASVPFVMAVDAGYNPHRLFDWRRYHGKPRWVRPVRGAGDMEGIVSNTKFMEVTTHTGRKSKMGNRYQHLNGPYLKLEIYQRLLRDDDGDDALIFPSSCDREFFEQLVSERRVPASKHELIDRTTMPKYKWIKLRQRNETLDMTVYALGMWYMAGGHRRKSVK